MAKPLSCNGVGYLRHGLMVGVDVPGELGPAKALKFSLRCSIAQLPRLISVPRLRLLAAVARSPARRAERSDGPRSHRLAGCR